MRCSELILLSVPWMGVTYLCFSRGTEVISGREAVEFLVVAWNRLETFHESVIHAVGLLVLGQCLVAKISNS